MRRHLLFFDLECCRYQTDVGEFAPEKYGVAVAVTYSTATQEFRFHTGTDLQPLRAELQSADLVVGYNLQFDFKVLLGAGLKLSGVKGLDMAFSIGLLASNCVPLDHVLGATFGIKPRLALPQVHELVKRGDLLQATEACCNDVEGMRRLYYHVKEQGQLHYRHRSTHRLGALAMRKLELRWPRKANVMVTDRGVEHRFSSKP